MSVECAASSTRHAPLFCFVRNPTSMGLFDTFRVSDERIELHTPAVYPGMLVRGVFSFTTSSTVPIRAIRVKLSGRERTHVQQSSGSGKHRRTHHYYGTVILHKELFTICGDVKLTPAGGDARDLPAGEYAIPFEFFLPYGLPSSSHAVVGPNYAKMEYQVKGYIDIPNGPDPKATAALEVLATMPVAQYATRGNGGIAEPLTVPVACCCCSKGSVKFGAQADKNIVSLDRPDAVTVTVTIDNSLGEEPVNAITVSFENRTSFSAAGHARCAVLRTSSQRQEVIVPKGTVQSVTMTVANITVPAGAQGGAVAVPRAPPSMIGKLIQSNWVVATELDIPYATDPVVTFPIVVTPRLDETNQAPPLDWTRNTYPELSKGQMTEWAYTVPPAMEQFARGLASLPVVTGGAPPAPYGGRIRCGEQGAAPGATYGSIY